MKKTWQTIPLLPVSWGEVFDKLTILQIKGEKLHDEAKLFNIEFERQAISKVVGDMQRFPEEIVHLLFELKRINEFLWDVEDSKRECERRKCFDERFIQLSRDVYFSNDQRAAIKRNINQLLGSTVIEEKSYEPY